MINLLIYQTQTITTINLVLDINCPLYKPRSHWKDHEAVRRIFNDHDAVKLILNDQNPLDASVTIVNPSYASGTILIGVQCNQDNPNDKNRQNSAIQCDLGRSG